MSNLLTIINHFYSLVNFTNYNKIVINVITFCFLFFLFGCDSNSKLETRRDDQCYKSASLIPPTDEESEFFKATFEKQAKPVYPWSANR